MRCIRDNPETKIRHHRENKFRALPLFPFTVFLLLIVGCGNGSKDSNKTSNENATIAVEAVKMNVLYLGVENPVNIAASGIDPTRIDVNFDNGRISRNGDQYLIAPDRTGKATLNVLKDGVEFGSKEFRVLDLPNPQDFLVIDGKEYSSGDIKITDLAKANAIKAEIPDFLFDVDFKITGFQVNLVSNGITVIEGSESESFTAAQQDLLKRVGQGQKVTIDEISAIGPDGLTRKLEPLVFTGI